MQRVLLSILIATLSGGVCGETDLVQRNPLAGTDLTGTDFVQNFVSRPDIKPAKWDVHIYNETRIAPGFWFVGPHEDHRITRPGGSWIGPHIFDGNGELVWSGSHLRDNIVVVDFKAVNVKGEQLLSMHGARRNAFLLDKHYLVRQTVRTAAPGTVPNTHDFHPVDNGTRFLYTQRLIRNWSTESIGIEGWCRIAFPGFAERSVEDGGETDEFQWNATDHVPLADSSVDIENEHRSCERDVWDYLHSNSIDKFNDGHYLLCARHSDTIYKISKDNGSILWRLHGGGVNSDFSMVNLNFSRQHHARLHENNDTHATISLLDNAFSTPRYPASSLWSRALKVALRFDTMTAELIYSVDHPHRELTFRRGSHQILPNGNSFVGWSERALHSEHTADGEIVMEAQLTSEILGTYRAFKSEFVGDPQYPPDISSTAHSDVHGALKSTVHVSWNGATEVSSWILYKTDRDGERSIALAQAPRSGFETALEYLGFANYVYVQALDKNGKRMEFGQSETVQTDISEADYSSSAFAEEMAWLDGESQTDTYDMFTGTAGGLVTAVLTSLACFYIARRRHQEKRKNVAIKAEYSLAAEELTEFLATDEEEDDDTKDGGTHGRPPDLYEKPGA